MYMSVPVIVVNRLALLSCLQYWPFEDDCDIVITSYKCLLEDARHFENIRWKCLVLDDVSISCHCFIYFFTV